MSFTESAYSLKRLREEASLSQEALARLINVSVTTISRWETGRHEPTFNVRQMKALCKALGKSLDSLPDDLSGCTLSAGQSPS
jgi:transcriptional regulator with XRE-family HTH domain